VELPFFEIVPYPDDWNDPRQRERWDRGRADAFAISYEDLLLASHVPADRLSAEAWSRLLAADGDEVEQNDPIRVEGGLALLEDDTAALLPGCCIWIDEATDEWRRAAEAPPDDWTMLWIGHPWVLVRRRDDTLTISQPTESSEGDDLAVLVELPLADLGHALQDATDVASSAAPHLAEALTSHPTPQNAARRALGLRSSA